MKILNMIFTCARAIATEFVDAIEPNEETEPPGEVRPYKCIFDPPPDYKHHINTSNRTRSN